MVWLRSELARERAIGHRAKSPSRTAADQERALAASAMMRAALTPGVSSLAAVADWALPHYPLHAHLRYAHTQMRGLFLAPSKERTWRPSPYPRA